MEMILYDRLTFLAHNKGLRPETAGRLFMGSWGQKIFRDDQDYERYLSGFDLSFIVFFLSLPPALRRYTNQALRSSRAGLLTVP